MASYTRSNAWNRGGSFDNPDLLWYAKGVGALMSRALNDRSSWWFFAAIHGQYLPKTPNQQPGFPGWQSIPPAPAVPCAPLPSQSDRDSFWDQCQHQSWYFPPWHRGYLIAIEGHIRKAIIALGGPDTWALPYWNYLGPGNQYEIPPAFTEPTLPDDKTPNPLLVTARYGPKGDGNIYVPVPPVSSACMGNTVYTGSNAATPRPGFGGPQTGFSHDGGLSGNLESNPHNQVHVDVGGNAPGGQTWGLMSDPGIAALDPVFYVHHANIDRLWAHWNAGGNANPSNVAWLDGPAAAGERAFMMPMADGSVWVYTPQDVDSLTGLDYTYDDLATAASGPTTRRSLAIRLQKLGSPYMNGHAPDTSKDTAAESELVGAHDGALQITSSGARAQVRLDHGARSRLSNSLKTASLESPPDRAYLQLENVRGVHDAQKLEVFINGHPAGTVALFGLRRSSMKDAGHGGSGLSFELDVSGLIDALYIETGLAADTLDVKILPEHAVQADAPITVGRVSVYRERHR
jgi:tyrosinase